MSPRAQALRRPEQLLHLLRNLPRSFFLRREISRCLLLRSRTKHRVGSHTEFGSELLPTDQKVCKARLNSNKHPKHSEIDRRAGIERDPEQRHDQLAKVCAHCAAFYAEFIIIENFLKPCELISDLPNLDPQLTVFGDWSNILCGLFNSRTELLCMKHQFGQRFGVFTHSPKIASRSNLSKRKTSRIFGIFKFSRGAVQISLGFTRELVPFLKDMGRRKATVTLLLSNRSDRAARSNPDFSHVGVNR